MKPRLVLLIFVLVAVPTFGQQLMPGQPKKTNEPRICGLTLVVGCSMPVLALNIANASASFADTWSTQRVMALCHIYRGCVKASVEGNPLTAPFQTHGSTVAYISTSAALVGSSMVEHWMRNSHNRVFRNLWFVPKVALTVTSTIFAVKNNNFYNRKLEVCGRGCVETRR